MAAETPENPVELTSNNKNSNKGLRYYYRHREEVLEKIRLKRLEDPEYALKVAAKEAAKEEKRIAQEQKEALKAQREAEKKQREEEKAREKEERRRAKAVALGAFPLPSFALTENPPVQNQNVLNLKDF